MRSATAAATRVEARRPVPPCADGSAVSSRIGLEVRLRPVGGGPSRRSPPRPHRLAASASAAGTWRTLMTGSGMRSRSSGGSSPWSWTASRPRRPAIAATSSAGRSVKTPTIAGPAPGADERPSDRRRARPPPPRSGRAACPGRGSARSRRRRRRSRRARPARLGDPADLHERPAAVDRGIGAGRRVRACLHERRDPRTDRRRVVAAAHELLADERGVEAQRPPSAEDRRVADAGLGDDDAVGRDPLAQPVGEPLVDRQRPQVAVVDADDARVGRQGRVELAGVVRLDERLEAEVERLRGPGDRGGAPDAGPRAAGPRPRPPPAATGAAARPRRTPWRGPGGSWPPAPPRRSSIEPPK